MQYKIQQLVLISIEFLMKKIKRFNIYLKASFLIKVLRNLDEIEIALWAKHVDS